MELPANQLRGFSPRTNYTDRRLSAKLMPTFTDRGVSHGQCDGSPTAVISNFFRPDFITTIAQITSLEHSHEVV
jgi:hypothetical protein